MAAKVLVAGGAGFLGSHIVDRLIEDGHSVFVLDDLSATGGSERYVDKKAQLVVDDVRMVGPDIFSDHVQPFDAVINLVAQPFIPYGTDDPETTASINVCGTSHLLRLISTKWFIQWSSSEVYGSAQTPKMTESHPISPQSFYAATKFMQEVMVREFCEAKHVPWTVIRSFNSFGPRETHPYVIPEIIRQAVTGTIEIGNQTAKRDFIYVEDLARAVSALVACGWACAGGRILNLATGEDHAVYEIIEVVRRVLECEFNVVECRDRLRSNDVSRLTGDASTFSKLTGWSPEVGFVYGMRKTIEWYNKTRKWVYEDGS